MGNTTSDTEQIILQAARQEFISKGYDGARMQAIATEAGINKALVHYYFRSKQKLFDAVFLEVFAKILPQVDHLTDGTVDIFTGLHSFISGYIDVIIQNPHIPGFILHELNRNQDGIARLFAPKMLQLQLFVARLEQEMQLGNIKTMDANHLFANILGLCIFPFIARPILQLMLMNDDTARWQQFVAERKEEVYQFIYNSIQP
ncbi:MAG TPA: TetR/AcrR family transcriptional regulator [Bacteroidales bacterium]|nr:TetR/AcrR family transcriptional regulator [Bacteroidales bacterium]